MKRRDFISRTAALAGGTLLPLAAGAGSGGKGDRRRAAGAFFDRFPACTEFEAKVPIIRVATGRIIHRFFDTSPISPSGRFMALFRLPNENRSPQPGETGEVVLVDLETAQERVVAVTRGWETQMGANVQWGASDADLFFNDVAPRTWTPFAVHLDPATGATRRFGGTVFTVSPDGRQLTSYNLIASRRIQVGYGVVVPEAFTPRNVGPVAHDGLYLTDIAGGETRMIASIRDIYERAVPSLRLDHPERYEYYCFQIRWNRQGTRVMAFLRWADPTGQTKVRLLALVTMKPDGSDIRVAVTPQQYARGGHHPMWTPDGRHLTLNLRLKPGANSGLDIVQVGYDGSDLHSIYPVGSGHPSMHPTLPFMITDSYHTEPVARGDGTAPLRLIDLRSKTETVIAQVVARRRESGNLTSEFRIDGHPVWDKSGRLVVFNGVHRDTRAVFVADLGPWLDRAMARS